MPTPRVFISCGQSEEGNERDIAESIHAIVEAAGFEPYLAFRHQSLSGFKEGVLSRLQRSEYFLFVDFKREELKSGRSSTPKFRGSLFCHQELAMAAMLEIEVAIFVHEDMERNGILKYVMGNAHEFREPDDLLKKIKTTIRSWKKEWMNELILERAPNGTESHRVQNSVTGQIETYANIRVRNRHKLRPAFNCYSFLKSCNRIERSGDLMPLEIESIEFAWAGSLYSNALIQPGQTRLLNVCVHSGPDTRFCVNTTFSGFKEPLCAGRYLLDFVVYSENFLPAEGRFQLTVSPQTAKIDPV